MGSFFVGRAMRKPGFSFVEVLAPCPTIFLRRNRLGDGLAMMKVFQKKSVIKNNVITQEAVIDYVKGPIVVGNFVNRNRPPFLKKYHDVMAKQLGDKFVPYSYGCTTLDEYDGDSHMEDEPWY